ncbi:MAG: SPOR domain-containing protein [Candidatus Rokuibacteriota bacterium]
MAPIDDRDDPEQPRSILSAMWFRVVLVIVVLGVIAVLAVPHILDMVNAPPARQAASVKLAPGLTPAMPPPQPSSSPPVPEQAATPPVAPATEPTPPQPTEQPRAMEESPATKPPAAEPTEPAGKVLDAKGVGKAGRGAYWVQVGAFRDAAIAQRLAERLRADNYSVAESMKRTRSAPRSAPASEAGDRYNVFVSGMAPNELTAKLSAKGLNAEVVAGGAMIKPSLSLREAVALSRDLSTDGLQVQVRRAGRDEATAAAPAAGQAYHRVRVGSFPDRATALAVAKELEGKGYKSYIARGNQ